MVGECGDGNVVHRAGQSVGERVLRELQREAAGRVLERRNLLLAEGGADRDRTVARGIQHATAALVAGLQAAGASGVHAANGGSPVAYGSLRAVIRNPASVGGCAINSLIRRGTKTRAGQDVSTSELYVPATLTPPSLVSIAVTPATPSLSLGATQRFIATGTFSDSSTEQLASVTWSSSDTTITQISNDASNLGTAIAIAPGTVTITATAGGVSGSVTLTVGP